MSPVPRKNHDFDEMGLIESLKEEDSKGTEFEPYDPKMGLSESVEEEEGSESDAKKQGMLYKVMKSMSVVCAIVLSTLFISFINSPKTGHL